MSLVNKKRNAGFSLVELVTVIVLLGILSVVALGRFADQDQFAARGFFDDTVGAVRFAQKLAISSGCDVRVDLSTTSYEVQRSTTCTADNFSVKVKNPANRSLDYENTDIPAGYTITSGDITFDARGRREEATSDFVMTNTTTSYSFRVHADTGLVEVL